MGCHCLWFEEAVTHKMPPVTADSVSRDVYVPGGRPWEVSSMGPADFPVSSLSLAAPSGFIIYRAHVRDVELMLG